MRLHRFYIRQKIGAQQEVTVDSVELVNQLHRVFRLKSGDSVILFDGSGSDYECTISSFTKDSVSFVVSTVSHSRFVPPRQVTLYAALVKKDTFEWIVEKATELGVTAIVPIQADRSEKKGLNMDRLIKIAIEASEQSGRGTVPEIMQVRPAHEAINACKDIGAIAFHTEGRPFMHAGIASDADVSLFIGPEGGWSEDEVTMFERCNIYVTSLGKQVLRAETAVVAALSLVLLGR